MAQIIPIRDLKNTAEISELCRNSTEPIFVTKNGYGDMVIMSMEVYEGIMNKIKIYNDLSVSKQQVADGKIKDAKQAVKDIRNKYGL